MVSALILLACLTLTLFFINREENIAREVLKTQGTSSARSLAREVQMLLPGSTPEQLQSLLDRFVEEEDVVSCAIKDGKGQILAEARSGAYPPEPEQVAAFSHPISGLSPEESDVGGPLGSVWIGLSKSPWTARIASLERSATTITFFVLLVGILATLLVVQITVKPLRMLLDATQRIAKGGLAEPVEIMSSGEIRDLSEALNEMASKLQQSRSQLEEYSKTLEKKAEERTQELKERIRELSDSRMATLNILEDVKEAETELERVNEELLALDEMKSKFIGTISHELKTPFTAVKSNVDFILSGKEGDVPRNLNQYLQTIQRNTNRVQKIMEDFLSVAQIHSGRTHLEPEDVKLGKAVRDCLAEMGPIHSKHSVKVEIPNNISVYADQNRLHDVYTNLLSNALKFSPEGGEIRVSARPHDGQVLSEVSDQGLGIPVDKLESIFDEFYQVDRKNYGGTGLGLSIVKGIIQEHGGRIWVDSRPGEGSTFFFTLPASKDARDGPIEESGKGSDR